MDAMQIAMEAFQTSRYADAVHAFTLAMREGYDPAHCWTMIGAALGQQGDWTGAEDASRRALEHSPGSGRAHYNLALCCERQGKLQEAADYLDTSLRLDSAHAAASEMSKSVRDRLDRQRTINPVELVMGPETALYALIPRESILNKDLCDIKPLIELWTQTPAFARGSRGVCSLGIHGYDEDPREISQIPEVREWWLLLERECSYIFWFLDPAFYLPLAACALNVEFEGGQVFFDIEEASSYVRDKALWIVALAAQINEDPFPVVRGIYKALNISFDEETEKDFRWMVAEVQQAIANRSSREHCSLHFQVVENILAMQSARIEVEMKQCQDEGSELAKRALTLLNNRGERCEAACALCTLSRSQYIEPVLRTLERMTWPEAMKLSEHLPRFGDAVAAPLGRCALASDRKQTITACILGLKYLGTAASVAALGPLLDDRYGLDVAGEALAACGRAAVPILLDRLKHSKAPVREAAAKALALVGDLTVIASLETVAASDRSKVVRVMAQRSIDNLLGTADETNRLRTAFEQYVHEALDLMGKGEFEDARLRVYMAQPHGRVDDWKLLALRAVCEAGMDEKAEDPETMMAEACRLCGDAAAWKQFLDQIDF